MHEEESPEPSFPQQLFPPQLYEPDTFSAKCGGCFPHFSVICVILDLFVMLQSLHRPVVVSSISSPHLRGRYQLKSLSRHHFNAFSPVQKCGREKSGADEYEFTARCVSEPPCSVWFRFACNQHHACKPWSESLGSGGSSGSSIYH